MAILPTKTPEIKALMDALKAEKNDIEEQTVPLRAERDRLLASIQPTMDKIRKLEDLYLSIERPRMAELENQISALVRIMGARRMSDSATVSSTGV